MGHPAGMTAPAPSLGLFDTSPVGGSGCLIPAPQEWKSRLPTQPCCSGSGWGALCVLGCLAGLLFNHIVLLGCRLAGHLAGERSRLSQPFVSVSTAAFGFPVSSALCLRSKAKSQPRGLTAPPFLWCHSPWPGCRLLSTKESEVCFLCSTLGFQLYLLGRIGESVSTPSFWKQSVVPGLQLREGRIHLKL